MKAKENNTLFKGMKLNYKLFKMIYIKAGVSASWEHVAPVLLQFQFYVTCLALGAFCR